MGLRFIYFGSSRLGSRLDSSQAVVVVNRFAVSTGRVRVCVCRSAFVAVCVGGGDAYSSLLRAETINDETGRSKKAATLSATHHQDARHTKSPKKSKKQSRTPPAIEETRSDGRSTDSDRLRRLRHSPRKSVRKSLRNRRRRRRRRSRRRTGGTTVERPAAGHMCGRGRRHCTKKKRPLFIRTPPPLEPFDVAAPTTDRRVTKYPSPPNPPSPLSQPKCFFLSSLPSFSVDFYRASSKRRRLDDVEGGGGGSGGGGGGGGGGGSRGWRW